MRKLRRSLLGDQRGASAVEFALLAPILLMILAVMVDFGFTLLTSRNLDDALAGSGNYAIVNSASVTPAAAPQLAANIASLIPGDIDVVVTVNNGPTFTRTAGTPAAGGTAANANLCYCPTLAGGSINWGASQTCGATCPGVGMGQAGKFVVIAASQAFSPMFSSYGMVHDGTITRRTVVRVQ